MPSHDAIESDVMILHVDQWTYHEPAKRFLFLRMRDAYRGPKIVINHGCNMVDGCSSAQMRELIGDCHMVANSKTAHELWAVPSSTYIHHGMSAEEWPATDYANHNVLHVQPFSQQHGKCRNVAAIPRAEERVPVTWVGRDVKFASFTKYRQFLRSSSIFFHPSYASANPRARTEAMLTGLAIVTTDSHGESEYIRNGVNGFCSNDMDELLDHLEYLYRHPREVRRIGRAGRATAQELFGINGYIDRWNALLARVVGL
ncbi:glycosyltransferase [Sandaracinus amylolyticus]|uniref:Glycosyltransferase n=1 Tax=Sandaracinus amylolyticus TaxID=927083 RepID=A0A0F6W7S4_9BACT|nr:glycosyltransferase [Sandaracinus amylolyticus]